MLNSVKLLCNLFQSSVSEKYLSNLQKSKNKKKNHNKNHAFTSLHLICKETYEPQKCFCVVYLKKKKQCMFVWEVFVWSIKHYAQKFFIWWVQRSKLWETVGLGIEGDVWFSSRWPTVNMLVSELLKSSNPIPHLCCYFQ